MNLRSIVDHGLARMLPPKRGHSRYEFTVDTALADDYDFEKVKLGDIGRLRSTGNLVLHSIRPCPYYETLERIYTKFAAADIESSIIFVIKDEMPVWHLDI